MSIISLFVEEKEWEINLPKTARLLLWPMRVYELDLDTLLDSGHLYGLEVSMELFRTSVSLVPRDDPGSRRGGRASCFYAEQGLRLKVSDLPELGAWD